MDDTKSTANRKEEFYQSTLQRAWKAERERDMLVELLREIAGKEGRSPATVWAAHKARQALAQLESK